MKISKIYLRKGDMRMKKKIVSFLLTISLFTSNMLPVYASELEGVSFLTEKTEVHSEEVFEDTQTMTISENSYFCDDESSEEVEFHMPTSHEYSNKGEMKEDADDSEILDQAGSSNSSALSSYDGRQYCTSVKTQIGGTCWAYAELAAMESSLIKNGFVSTSIDLSELQHIYYFYNKVFDPLNNINEDYNYMVSNGTETTDFSRISENGGNNFYSAFRIANGNGLCLESELPYTSNSNAVSVGSNYCFKNDIAHIKNIYFCTFSPSNITKIKKMITNYGGVAAAYYTYNSSNYYKILDGTSSYYFPTAVKTVNHAIEIVGWDDNYSASNFVKTPAGNGAWLCKNSWGTENYLDSTGSPVDGYFWLSYYDGTYQQGIAIASAYEFEDLNSYDYLYQYDGASKPNSYNGNKAYMNVFSAKGEGIQKIEAVSVGISSSSASYYAKVYTNPVIQNNKIVSYDSSSSSVSKTVTQPGIYKTDISSDIYVSEGDTFAVVITMVNPNSYIFGSTTTTTTWANFYDHMDSAQSYYGTMDGTDIIFTDLSTLSSAYTPCIKTMTSVTDIPYATNVSITNKTKTELFAGNEMKLSATVSPENALQGVRWSSSNESVAVVDTNGKVTAINAGTCSIKAVSKDGQCYDEINITVKKLAEKVSISYDYEDTVYLKNGTTRTLSGVITPENTTDKSLTWESSNNSVVSVENGIIAGNKEGTAVITATNEASQLSDTITVEVINPVKAIDIETENIEIQNEELVLYTNDSSNRGILSAKTNTDATNKSLTTEISNPSVISYDEESGEIKGLIAGSTKITFAGQKDSVASAFSEDGTISNGTPVSKTISVLVRTQIQEIILEEEQMTMNVGEQKTIDLTISPSDAVKQDLLYSSNNADVAEVTDAGVVIAKKSGSCTILISDLKGNIQKECKIDVIQKAETIEVPTDIYMSVGESCGIDKDVSISVLPEDTDNKELDYVLSGDSVVLTDNGIKAIQSGISYLTVSTKDGSDLSQTIQIHVIKKASFIRTSDKMDLNDTDTKKLNVYVNSDASIQEFAFSSSDETIAIVDKEGNVTAKGKSGSCEIKAETTDGSNLSAICKVTVNVLVKDITLSADKTSLLLGESTQLSCSVTPSNATNKAVICTSSNTDVVIVNNGVITAVGKGQAVIIASSQDNSGIKKEITITVTSNEVETVETGNENVQTKLPNGTVLCDNKNNYYVVLNENEVSYSGTYNRDIKSVSIPASISYENSFYDVVIIADNAFNGCEKLKKVQLGNKITKIGKNAFKNCKSLKSVTIPNSVIEIGTNAFYGCSSLSKATLGTGIKTIKTKAFYNCKKLGKITIKSKKLKTVGKNAFKNVKAKVTIKVPKSKYKTYTTKTFKKAGFSKSAKYRKG